MTDKQKHPFRGVQTKEPYEPKVTPDYSKVSITVDGHGTLGLFGTEAEVNSHHKDFVAAYHNKNVIEGTFVDAGKYKNIDDYKVLPNYGQKEEDVVASTERQVDEGVGKDSFDIALEKVIARWKKAHAQLAADGTRYFHLADDGAKYKALYSIVTSAEREAK